MKRLLNIVFITTLLLSTLSACITTQAYHPETQTPDTAFHISGRLAVKIEEKGHYGNFSWQHLPEQKHDTIEITTPLGNSVARIESNQAGVQLTDNKNETYTAENAEILTEEVMGWALPLDNLTWWIQGKVAPNTPYKIEANGTLQQQGWQIQFFREQANNTKPKRVELIRKNLSIKIVIHDW